MISMIVAASMAAPPPAEARVTAAPAPVSAAMEVAWELVPVQRCGRRGCTVTYEYRKAVRAVQAPATPKEPAKAALKAEPKIETKSDVKIKEKKNKTVIKARTTTDALDQLNRQRMQRGLRPYVFDEGLTQAAERVASIKAASCHSGHLANDFAYLPPGCTASSAGADGSKIHASDPNFYTCCMYDNYTYAGASMAIGPDGCKYMSLFVR